MFRKMSRRQSTGRVASRAERGRGRRSQSGSPPHTTRCLFISPTGRCACSLAVVVATTADCLVAVLSFRAHWRKGVSWRAPWGGGGSGLEALHCHRVTPGGEGVPHTGGRCVLLCCKSSLWDGLLGVGGVLALYPTCGGTTAHAAPLPRIWSAAAVYEESLRRLRGTSTCQPTDVQQPHLPKLLTPQPIFPYAPSRTIPPLC